MQEVDYTMQAVETIYGGIRFRSRLEARWAAFFDVCRWRWEYEPADFNGWFPDFILVGSRGDRVFVEVKPIAEASAQLEARIDRSGCPAECMIVGLSPTLLCPDWGSGCRMGWLREDFGGWGEAAIVRSARTMQSPYRLDFCHATQSWRPRMLGIYTNNGEILTPDRHEVSEAWGLAHEMTRYDPF